MHAGSLATKIMLDAVTVVCIGVAIGPVLHAELACSVHSCAFYGNCGLLVDIDDKPKIDVRKI
jgi:hypothetical protein